MTHFSQSEGSPCKPAGANVSPLMSEVAKVTGGECFHSLSCQESRAAVTARSPFGFSLVMLCVYFHPGPGFTKHSKENPFITAVLLLIFITSE